MASKKSKVDLKRVNINLPINLVKKVEEYGESIGVNTTAAYIVLLNQALEQKMAFKNFPLMYQMFEEAQKQQLNLDYDNIDN